MTPTHFSLFGITFGLWIASLILWCVVIPVCVGFLSRRNMAIAILACVAMAAYSTVWAQVLAAHFNDVCLKMANELIQRHVEVTGNSSCTAFAFDWARFAMLLLLMVPGFMFGAALGWWIGKPRRVAVPAL